MINLYTSFILSKNGQRNREFISVLKFNLNLGVFTNIYLITDENTKCLLNRNLNSVNLIYIINDERPTFGFMLDLFKPNFVNIISNGDIKFTKTITYAEFILTEYNVLTLSRWSVKYKCFPYVEKFTIGNSQDVFGFKGRLPSLIGEFDFFIGQPACDNKFCYLLSENGYQLLNVCFDIITFHVHKNSMIHYDAASCIPPPYTYIKANFNDIFSVIGKLRYYYMLFFVRIFK